MHEKNKNPFHLLLLIGLLVLFIPFILIKDFYPFMRLGMFAEPVRHEAQMERFLVFIERENKTNLINSESFGILPHNFDYLCRNYHYRNEDTLLLKKLAQALNLPTGGKLSFYILSKQDTSLTASYAP